MKKVVVGMFLVIVLISFVCSDNGDIEKDNLFEKIFDFIKKLLFGQEEKVLLAPAGEFDKVILISVDGLQLNHFNDMLSLGELPNFELVINEGFYGNAEITHHEWTETAPGHAEMLSGLGQDMTNVIRNTGESIPDGLSVFERIESARSEIVTGSVWGKHNTYVPNALLGNAISDIDWWQDLNTWTPEPWIDGYASSVGVATKATEFINSYANNDFFLFIHFESPDISGHAVGENSENYDLAVKNVDEGLGILLDSLVTNGISDKVKIIITADHGFREDSRMHDDTCGGWDGNTCLHPTNIPDTAIVPLISNDVDLVGSETSNGYREQCEIIPTILDYFGIGYDFYGGLSYSCDSMMPSSICSTPENLNSYCNAEKTKACNPDGLCEYICDMADVNADGKVDETDLIEIDSCNGKYFSEPSCRRMDLNRDSKVDLSDLLICNGRMGSTNYDSCFEPDCSVEHECDIGYSFDCEDDFFCWVGCLPFEICGNGEDDNCNGQEDEEPCCPYEEEICDGIDNDCDNEIDEGCDDDNDDYCDENMIREEPYFCDNLGTWCCDNGGGDCEDSWMKFVNPGMEYETCWVGTSGLGIDGNCDGTIDGFNTEICKVPDLSNHLETEKEGLEILRILLYTDTHFWTNYEEVDYFDYYANFLEGADGFYDYAFVLGDWADSGKSDVKAYALPKQILEEKNADSKTFVFPGNHDNAGGLSNFVTYFSSYASFAVQVGNVMFVGMGDESDVLEGNTELSEETLSWFRDDILELNKDKIILGATHFPLLLGDTYQAGMFLKQSSDVQDILDDYIVDFWFHGHLYNCGTGDRERIFEETKQYCVNPIKAGGGGGHPANVFGSMRLTFTEGSNQVIVEKGEHTDPLNPVFSYYDTRTLSRVYKSGNCVDLDNDGMLDYDETYCPDGKDKNVEDKDFRKRDYLNLVPSTANFEIPVLEDDVLLNDVDFYIKKDGKERIDFIDGVCLVNVDADGKFIEDANIDLDSAVEIGDTKIKIDTSLARTFNKPANLFFYGSFREPQIKKDEIGCLDCLLVSNSGGVIQFEVSGFSEYEVVEGYVSPPGNGNGNGNGNGGGGDSKQCNDGIDNDRDGLIDYPDDPGCVSLNDDNETDILICTERWVCYDYGECVDGKKVRKCIDLMACGSEINKPELEDECGDEIIYEKKTKRFYEQYLLWGIVLLVILAGIIVLIFYLIKKRN